MEYYVYVVTVLSGLVMGSFLNAVIYRLQSGESIIKERSHCPKCEHVLVWYELIPLVSFILQFGKCRSCKKSISWQYPLVEIGTAVLFLLIIANFELRIANEFLISEFLKLSYYITIASLSIVIFVYDLKHYIIPDRIVFPAIFLVFVNRAFEFLSLNNWSFIKNSKFEIQNLEGLLWPLGAAIVAATIFATIFFLSRGQWLGFGDVKLVFFMGLFLGWPNIAAALFIAFILGGMIGLALIAIRRKKLKSQIPFGPLLITGTFGAFFWGEGLIKWYLDFILL